MESKLKISTVTKDLFDLKDTHVLCHCISADAAMGKGIAKLFVKEYPKMKSKLKDLSIGDVIFYDGKVLNLVTKEKYYDKPSRKNFNETIIKLKNVVEENEIKKLAMPLIGSGLDKLSWFVSYEFIVETFKDSDVEIIVCTIE